MSDLCLSVVDLVQCGKENDLNVTKIGNSFLFLFDLISILKCAPKLLFVFSSEFC